MDEYNSQFCECTICGSDKALTGTKVCNGCWEVTRRLDRFLQEGPKAIEFVCSTLAAQDPRFTCIRTLPADEPIFILRAQDQLAAQTVQAWIHSAMRHYSSKYIKAQEVLRAMLEWANAHETKVPD